MSEELACEAPTRPIPERGLQSAVQRTLAGFHELWPKPSLEGPGSTGAPPIDVTLVDDEHTLFSVTEGRRGPTFHLHPVLACAPRGVISDMIRFAQDDCARAQARIQDYVEGRLEPSIPPALASHLGRHHDLRAIFHDLNREYFSFGVRARIEWAELHGGPQANAEPGSCTLGQYVVEDQLIRVNARLDRGDVPRFFIAFVVYHEMLHQLYDMPVVDGIRVWHTREFRLAEARFGQYAEAVEFERHTLPNLLD